MLTASDLITILILGYEHDNLDMFFNLPLHEWILDYKWKSKIKNRTSSHELSEDELPPHLLELVEKDNTEFVLDSSIYASPFFNFIKLNMNICEEHCKSVHLAPYD